MGRPRFFFYRHTSSRNRLERFAGVAGSITDGKMRSLEGEISDPRESRQCTSIVMVAAASFRESHVELCCYNVPGVLFPLKAN